jgi:hypothetical protein
MQRENIISSQTQPDVYQQRRRIRKEIRHTENLVINQEIKQTSESQNHAFADYASTSQAPESERDQLHNEHGMLENVKSNIWTCSVKTIAELRNLILSTEQQKKRVQKFLKVQESREKNVAEAKHRNEAMGLELQMSQRNLQELEAK